MTRSVSAALMELRTKALVHGPCEIMQVSAAQGHGTVFVMRLWKTFHDNTPSLAGCVSVNGQDYPTVVVQSTVRSQAVAAVLACAGEIEGVR